MSEHASQREIEPRKGNTHTAEDHMLVDTNGVFVNILHGSLWVKSVFALNEHRDNPCLYVQVTSEFPGSQISVSAHDNVRTWLVDEFINRFTFLLSDTPYSQASKLDSLTNQ